jgi:uncharacterized membrane protein
MTNDIKTTKKSSIQKYWHEFFEIGIALKAFNGIWETGSGILFFVLSKATLNNWVYKATENELLEDPHDLIINFLVNKFQTFSSGAQRFAAIYLLFHGLLNIFLAIQLRRNKIWAYPVMITSIIIFMIYQVHRILVHHSLFLTLITVFDVIFLLLTVHEYRTIKNKNNQINNYE